MTVIVTRSTSPTTVSTKSKDTTEQGDLGQGTATWKCVYFQEEVY